jgi:hypothetical protein
MKSQISHFWTNSMKQSPSCKANRSSACQETAHISWPPKYHNSVQNGHIPSQINPVHAFPHLFLEDGFQSVPHLRLGLPSCLLPSGVTDTALYAILFPLTLGTSPTSPFSYHSNSIWWRAEPVRILTLHLQFLVTLLRPKCRHRHYPRTSALCPRSMWQTRFHTHNSHYWRSNKQNTILVSLTNVIR